MVSKWKYGTVLKSKSITNYKYTETAYTFNTTLLSHAHEYAYFCFVIQGNFVESYGKRKQEYSQSNLIFHPLEETHSNYFHTNSRCFNIQLSSQYLRISSLVQELPKHSLVFKGEQINYLATRLYKEFLSMDEFSALAIEGLMLEIIAESLRRSRKRSRVDATKWLLRVKEILDEEFMQNLTIDLIARSVNVHPNHLVREFRRYFKMTIGDYVRRKRIEQAIIQLVSSDIPISELALATGFFDQSHLTRVFKKVTGMTPAVYRNTFSSR